jgi:NAD(P)-dependent dehydrogenase (short-subunit alcohol dehydrogenase family)
LLKLDDIASLGPALFERFGRLDLFIANAAMLGHFGPVAHYDAKIWDRVMALNFTANHRLIQTLDRLLRAAPNGRAFFITDGAAEAMAAYGGAYAVSKAALTRMVMQYAAETKQTTLRVNLVDPGAMRTSLRAQGFPGEDPALLRDPDSVAAAIMPLLMESGTHHGELLQPGLPPVHFADLELSRRVC